MLWTLCKWFRSTHGYREIGWARWVVVEQALFLAGEDLFGLFSGFLGARETGNFGLLVDFLDGEFGLFATGFAFAFAHDCGVCGGELEILLQRSWDSSRNIFEQGLQHLAGKDTSRNWTRV